MDAAEQRLDADRLLTCPPQSRASGVFRQNSLGCHSTRHDPWLAFGTPSHRELCSEFPEFRFESRDATTSMSFAGVHPAATSCANRAVRRANLEFCSHSQTPRAVSCRSEKDFRDRTSSSACSPTQVGHASSRGRPRSLWAVSFQFASDRMRACVRETRRAQRGASLRS
jgi:hypothetical protein